MTAEEHAKNVRFLVHEFNNQLFVIGGHCELLAQQLDGNIQASADLSAISEAAEKATALAAQMRALAIEHAGAGAP
jgi:hypothetical protein